MKKLFSEYCTGCGLCASTNYVDMVRDEKGFIVPNVNNATKKDIDFMKKVCICSNNPQLIKGGNKANIWGEYKNVYIGYSNDSYVRYSASSGGVITEVAVYLLEHKLVNGIIHVGANPDDPINTKVFISTTRDEIISRCGSRYAASAPLININQVLDKSLKYAFIGKPCDIIILKNYMRLNRDMERMIPYTLSFFCAGVPSEKANEKLLSELGCHRNECQSLAYRGSGWPGYTTAADGKNRKFTMRYQKSWVEILGRDVRKVCRFCMDGIGEQADIACGDAWYLDEDKNPVFDEREGRNVVFARNEKGNEILTKMQFEKRIILSDFSNDMCDLNKMQPYQFIRKTTVLPKVLALKMFFKPVPKYNWALMLNYTRENMSIVQIRLFLGTIKRIVKGKI